MIKSAIERAERMHRKVLEQTYDDVCRVYGLQSVKDPQSKVTQRKEAVLLENIPCHISFSSDASVGKSATASPVTQTIKLFLSPEVLIPPGSRIEVVRRQGNAESYAQSGQAAVYSSHQEIVLELWKGYA